MLRKALNSERTKLPPNLFPHISRHFSHSTTKRSHALLRSRLPEDLGGSPSHFSSGLPHSNLRPSLTSGFI